MTTFTHIWQWWARLIAGVNRCFSETMQISHPLTLTMGASMDPMTQRSDSCGRVYGGSASEVPFPWLERVRLDCECDSEVQLTSAVRRVHAKDQRSKTDVYTNFVYKECSELLLLSLV